MKLGTGPLLFLALLFLGCSTTVKILENGPVEANRTERGELLAPILMQYSFNIPNDKHVIYVFDESKNRYDITVPGDIDTRRGIVFYLPAQKEYAVVGMYIYRSHGTEFVFGDNLDLFSLDPGKINVLPSFEMAMNEHRNGFEARERAPDDLYLAEAEKKYGKLLPFRPIKIRLIRHVKLH